MATIYLPNSIRYKAPLSSGFAYIFGSSKIESITGDGKLHSRNTPYTPQDEMALSFLYNQDEYDSFMNFFRVTLKNGVLPFRINNPITSEEIEVQIFGVPQINFGENRNYVVNIKVKVTLEI